ncbi:MAG: hypothetical protein U0236_20010 [Nitrospira sp.]
MDNSRRPALMELRRWVVLAVLAEVPFLPPVGHRWDCRIERLLANPSVLTQLELLGRLQPGGRSALQVSARLFDEQAVKGEQTGVEAAGEKGPV